MGKLGTKKASWPLRLVVGGLVLAGVTGGGYMVKQVDESGGESSRAYVAHEEINVRVDPTSLTGACIKSPLDILGQGSGTVIRASVEWGNAADSLTGDLGFVAACGTGSGEQLINGTTAGTGAVSFYTTGTQAWNGDHYLKYLMTATGAATVNTARIRIEYEDMFGE